MAALAEALYTLVERTVEGLGYELVDVERAGGGLLRVTLDTATAQGPRSAIGVGDCERVSHQLTHLFAVENVDYDRLEVSSPGVDRPLKSARDFVRFTGAQIQLRLVEPLQGVNRKRLQGRLLGVVGEPGGERISLELADESVNAETSAGGAPARNPAKSLKVKAAKSPKKKPVASAPAQIVDVPLSRIERARLVPQLSFRSTQ